MQPRKTEDNSKFQILEWFFFRVFLGVFSAFWAFFPDFPFWPILTGLTDSGLVPVVHVGNKIAFIRHLQGSMGNICLNWEFLASQDLTGDMIFEWLEFQFTPKKRKIRKSATTNRQKSKNTEKKNRRRLLQISNLGLVLIGFFEFFRRKIFGFLWVAPPKGLRLRQKS